MNIKEATDFLKAFNITNSEQVVRRWIRQGKLKAQLKSGTYDITESVLIDFIKENGKVTIREMDDRIKKAVKETEDKYQAEIDELKKEKGTDPIEK